MMMMMMMMMKNCYCGMVDRRKVFSLISSRDHCQRSSTSQISDTPRAGFEPAQNLSSDLVEWSCAAVITTTPRRHSLFLNLFLTVATLTFLFLNLSQALFFIFLLGLVFYIMQKNFFYDELHISWYEIISQLITKSVFSNTINNLNSVILIH